MLHLIGTLERGGTEAQLVEFIRRSSRPERHFVLAWAGGGPLAEGLPNEPFVVSGARPRMRDPIDLWRLSKSARRAKVQVGADLVHAHLSASEMLAATAFPRGVEIVASRRGRTPNHDGKHWYRTAQRYAHARVALMICNSEELASHTMATDPAPPPLAVVHNGVDLDGLQPAALPREPTIAMVANFIDYKRHDRFLEAFQVVRSAIPSAQAVLVGDGPERSSVEATDRHDATGLIRAAGGIGPQPGSATCWRRRVIALTSDHEGLPNVLLEGMAMARPVVSTSVGGVPELVTDGVEGRTCSLDPEDIGKALVSVLSTPDLAEEMGAAARRRAEAFGWPRVVEQTERLYRRVASGERFPRGAMVA